MLLLNDLKFKNPLPNNNKNWSVAVSEYKIENLIFNLEKRN